MSQKFLKKLERVYRRVSKSLTVRSGKTTLGVWGESQAKKLKNLGQDMVVMQMG